MTNAHPDRRSSDRALKWMIGFLIVIVCVSIGVGLRALHTQEQATCYQLRSVEQAEQRERRLERTSFGASAETHRKSAEDLRDYAAGLRSIVPSCPRPTPERGDAGGSN